MTVALEVLPDQDYLCRIQKVYVNGTLACQYTFGEYRRLGNGRPYPFKQGYVLIERGGDTKSKELLRSRNGAALFDADDARLTGMTARHVRRVIRTIELPSALADETFDVPLEKGASIVETRYPNDIRMRLERDSLQRPSWHASPARERRSQAFHTSR